MTTQELTGRAPSAPPTNPVNPPAAAQPRDTVTHKPWVSNSEAQALPSAAQTAVFDPDATVVIGLHRADGTREYRSIAAGQPQPARTARGGWRATVSRLLFRRRTGAGA
jgi:hypothetical protein